MGIDASWVSETGSPKETILDPSQCLAGIAMERWHKLDETKCLQFIDPWGDTTFNQSQIPALLEELRSEIRESNEVAVKSHLDNVLALVERAAGQIHTYIKFIGD